MASPARPALAATLRRLREDAGLSGSEAARQAGLAQARVSRMETGRRVPDESDIRALARVYKIPADARRRLLAAVRDLQPSSIPARTMLHRAGGGARMQVRIERLEQAAERIRYFNPVLVIGLLQTEEYARALLSGAYGGTELDSVVAARMARQSALDTDRRFHLVVTEGALRWHIGGPEVMARQLQRIAAAVDRSNVTFGVVPWTRPVTWPVLHPFQCYDENAVLVGTETATAVHTDPADVADYNAKFERYAAAADEGDAARATLDRLHHEYLGL